MKKPLDSKFAIFGCVFCEEFEWDYITILK
jgi:hypothetical protein